jgi:hypothetical protein
VIARSLGFGAILLALAATAAAQDAPRLRIVSASGPVSSPHKVYFGGSEAFYAVPEPADGDPAALHPSRAVGGVEWWAFRTFDMRESHPRVADRAGQEVGHRKPRGGQWGDAPRPFLCPREMRATWSSGRYLIRAAHPDLGTVDLPLTVASLLLVGHDAKISATSYEASFFVSLADPDLSGPDVPVDVRVLDRAGRTLDRIPGARLVRRGLAHRSPRRIRLSSRLPAPADIEANEASREGRLHVEEDARLRLAFGDRVFEFPLPLEEGPLVRKNDSSSTGREGDGLVSSRKLERGGGRNKPDRLPARSAKPRSGPGHGRAGTPVSGSSDGPMQIISSSGRRRRVKVWMGETAVFAARLRPRGPEDLFRPVRWLRDVHWTLTRLTPPDGKDPDAISRGVGSSMLGRMSPRGLWGDPPSLFQAPKHVEGAWRPGMHVLRAERTGSPPAEMRVDLASFEIIRVDAELREGFYAAALSFRLEDPTEMRKLVPLVVQIVNGRGEILDYVRGVGLTRVTSRRHVLESSRVILSSRVALPNRTRYEERDPARRPPPGTPCVLRVTPGSRLRVVLDGTVFEYPLPLVVSEVIAGGSPTDPRQGR